MLQFPLQNQHRITISRSILRAIEDGTNIHMRHPHLQKPKRRWLENPNRMRKRKEQWVMIRVVSA